MIRNGSTYLDYTSDHSVNGDMNCICVHVAGKHSSIQGVHAPRMVVCVSVVEML